MADTENTAPQNNDGATVDRAAEERAEFEARQREHDAQKAKERAAWRSLYIYDKIVEKYYRADAEKFGEQFDKENPQ